jgi:hypothetical protein
VFLKEITDNPRGLKCDFQAPARNRDGEPKRRKRLSVQERMLKRSSENGKAPEFRRIGRGIKQEKQGVALLFSYNI